tara:strand:+ start:356 stop:814 length:459 start_codon:yes stop_codon:yes gene_type:complete
MSLFSTGDFFAELARVIPRTYEFVNAKVEVLPLTNALIDDVKSCINYDEMVKLAADSGLSYNDGLRVVDNDKLARSISGFWEREEMKGDDADCDQVKVGEIVCEISGLTSFIVEQLEKEAKIKVGDHMIAGGTELGNLDSEQLAQDAINNAA